MEATAKELMLPGTMVLLRTPQGEFVFGYGATELGDLGQINTQVVDLPAGREHETLQSLASDPRVEGGRARGRGGGHGISLRRALAG